MKPVLIDDKLINEFLTRGVDNVYPSKEALRKVLKSGKRIKAYQGFDPTGKYLHVGHAMGIRGLRILQQLGHEVIFLVGDFTARIGDPDKDKTRKLLTTKEIEENMKGWKEQAAQLINFVGANPVRFMHNYQWLSKLKLDDLIELMSKATVQQMIERDMFDRRLKENDPIRLQEFIYPLMQGYDSVAMRVDLELGGTDQLFNMLMGRSLCKAYLDKEKFVRTNILMEAPDALTMSKTKGNGINLSDTPEDMYGKAMSYSDDLIVKGLRLLTEVPLEDIVEIENEIKKGKNQMTHKKFMAYEIVKTIMGDKKAAKAQEHFEQTVQQGQMASGDMTTTKIKGYMTLLDFLKLTNPNDLSSAELKRVVAQGGVELNDNKVLDFNQELEFNIGDVVKIGKRTYVKVE